jgi:hypothetical protein
MADEPPTASSDNAEEPSIGSSSGQVSTTSLSEGWPPEPWTKEGSSLYQHAARELERVAQAAGEDDEEQRAMNAHILKMIEVFCQEGHSGFSAAYSIAVLSRLLKYEPLTVLQGTADEWMEVAPGVHQNVRCSHVFREDSRFEGRAYDISTRVYEDPDGARFQRGGDAVPIMFPYAPPERPEVIPVDKDGFRTFRVDYVYDAEDWEYTAAWEGEGFREMLEDRPHPHLPYKLRSLIKGPDIYAIDIPTEWDEDGDIEDTETRFFLLPEEALKARDQAIEEANGQRSPANPGEAQGGHAVSGEGDRPDAQPKPHQQNGGVRDPDV